MFMECLKLHLLQGNYMEAEEVCNTMDVDSIRDMVMTIAYDIENICVYRFIRYMIERTKNVGWVELAIDVMLHPLCFVEGAYSVALFHARELLLKNKSVENLERILFFYNLPEKLVEKKEAQCIAKEILKVEPDNEIALEI